MRRKNPIKYPIVQSTRGSQNCGCASGSFRPIYAKDSMCNRLRESNLEDRILEAHSDSEVINLFQNFALVAVLQLSGVFF
jgi:hypothetical protein